ncbi:NRDE family protein [Salinarchaeum chitinilyticum]
MCTIAFAWQVLADAPIAVAANRDEALDRESLPPQLLEGDLEIVAPQDAEAGGTWIGVTERGLFVAITNRWTAEAPPDLPAERSRGLLVRDALDAADASAAVDLVREQVDTYRYAGFNLLVADANRATYLEWDGDLRVEDLDPGVHVIVNPGIDEADERAVRLRDALEERIVADEPPTVDAGGGELPAVDGDAGDAPSPAAGTDASRTAAAWLADAASLLRDHEYEVCIHRDEFGTRSSSLVSVGDGGTATYAFADGPPCETDYVGLELPASFLDSTASFLDRRG